MSASIAAPARSTPSSARTGRGSRPSSGSPAGSSTPIWARSGSGANPFAGIPRRWRRKLGLAMAYQDTSLILPEPVKNNLFLAAPEDRRPPFWRRKRWARKLLAEFDLDLELFPDAPAGFLTLADRQLFEVAKALVADPKVLLLDEPTTALGPDEVDALHRTVAACSRPWRRCGVREPSSAGGPRDRRPDHRPSRRQEPGDVRREGHDRGGARRADRRPPVRGRVPAARPRGGRAAARCSWSTGLQGQSFGPVSFTLERRRDRGDRRRRRERAAPALRLPGRPPAAEGGTGGLRRQGAVADLDP